MNILLLYQPKQAVATLPKENNSSTACLVALGKAFIATFVPDFNAIFLDLPRFLWCLYATLIFPNNFWIPPTALAAFLTFNILAQGIAFCAIALSIVRAHASLPYVTTVLQFGTNWIFLSVAIYLYPL